MNDTDAIVDRPIPRSYWVERGRVLAGEYPGSERESDALRKINKLLGAGVTLFIDLTHPDDRSHSGKQLLPYDGLLPTNAPLSGREVEHCRRPIQDGSTTGVTEMNALLDEINTATSNGHIVYFHCWGGHGRTGTVAGCYMVRHGSTPQDALDAIKRLRKGAPRCERISPEPGAQTELVRHWPELDLRIPSQDAR